MENNSKENFSKIIVMRKNSSNEVFIHLSFILECVQCNCKIRRPKKKSD